MPWEKQDNPFGPKKKVIDIYVTSIEVQCEGCIAEGQRNRSINIRILEEDFNNEGHGIKKKHCSRCMAQTQFEVHVYSNGAINAMQANKFGANQHNVAFKKLDQKRTKKVVG